MFIDGVRGTAENRLDFATTPACSGDVIRALTAPKGALFTNVRTRVVTKQDAACTADVGDGDDPNGYNDAVDFNATNGTIEMTREADPYAEGKLYTVDDEVDVTLDHDADVAVIDIWGDYVMLERYAP
jgi:hypothetical protein